MKFTLNIYPMTPQEKIYARLQSSQISGQTGFVGRLSGSFHPQKDLSMQWKVLKEPLETEAFRSDSQDVLKELKETVFKDRNSMQEYCAGHASLFPNQDAEVYGLRVDSRQYSYLMLYNPQLKDNCLDLYAYHSKWLKHHMNKAEWGISFITPDYKEKFRVADGERIRLIGADGNFRDRVCRYVDDYHFETEGGFGGALYHICQFAELCEKTGSQVIRLDQKQNDSRQEQRHSRRIRRQER